ncbi:MAG TPA: hypothetical protein VNG13_10165 [Mycobacteriales bacterium]|nr:hypothetical protein [Mycobacteriales bacterium]
MAVPDFGDAVELLSICGLLSGLGAGDSRPPGGEWAALEELEEIDFLLRN